jgi:hypothetical protein
MDKETKTLFITLAGVLVLIWVLKPKSSKSKKNLLDVKYAEPNQVSDKELKQKENATIGLQAMREAINSKENKKELDKLSSMIFQDYGVKIMANKKTGLLRAMSKDGKVIAQESVE